jgi:hypothetical protein
MPDNPIIYCKVDDKTQQFKLSSDKRHDYAFYKHKNSWRVSAHYTNSQIVTDKTFQIYKPDQVDPVKEPVVKRENSGAACSYYRVNIDYPESEDQEPYIAECVDIMRALGMTYDESNMFKEIWRTAAERTLGKGKEGNNARRAAEKILFFAKGNYNQVFKPPRTKNLP